MKDEYPIEQVQQVYNEQVYFNGDKIDEFVRLKSKMYSLLACNDLEVNKAKGVNLKLKHRKYVDVFLVEKS